MLTEIYCSSFGEDKKIPFTSGLNVIQGRSGNSIGKSNILKIVDYAFGGGYYAKSNKDVIKHVGEHDICFCHMFEGKSYYFIRSASSPARVSLCEDNSYQAIKEISTEEFCKWLTEMYALQDLRLTFRNIVSLYSRVWNKPNQVVNHPLSNYNNQSVAESITTLIKLFKRYDPIRELHEESVFLKKRSDIRKKAAEYNFISVPNRKNAEAIENELSEINTRIEKFFESQQYLSSRNELDSFISAIDLMELWNSKEELDTIWEFISKYSKDSKIDCEGVKKGFNDFFYGDNTEDLQDDSTSLKNERKESKDLLLTRLSRISNRAIRSKSGNKLAINRYKQRAIEEYECFDNESLIQFKKIFTLLKITKSKGKINFDELKEICANHKFITIDITINILN